MDNKPLTLLILNGKGAGNDDLRDAITTLREEGFEIAVRVTFEKGDGDRYVKEAITLRAATVVAGGGDGTINEVATALAASEAEHRPVLGILPLGTANDFARTLGIPATLEQAVQIITDGQLRAVDLGEVNQHLFLNVSSIGFSAELARNLTAESKKRWGVGGYALAALRLLRQSRPFSATLIHEEQRTPIRTVQVSVGNGRFYGGGMTVEARAAPDDGLLDVYSLEVRHSWQLIALLPFLRRGTQGRWRNVRTFSTTALTIETRRPHYINADGEIIGQTPAHFRLIAGAIQVYAPAGPTAE